MPQSLLYKYAYYKKQINSYIILAKEYGQFNTIKTGTCFDKNYEPIPWYTYPAIEYFKRLDFEDKTIFEYGCGNSSLFWANRVKRIISVESDKEWYHKILKEKSRNQEIILAKDKDEYIKSINKFGLMFDVIIVDGLYRYDCVLTSIDYLKRDGMIILDNSDWFPKSSECLRQKNLIQIDFSGFGPVNNYTWSTSIFINRDFDIKFLNKDELMHPIGGLKDNAEK